MPVRRPYASRGVPRRATTRRSGDAGVSVGLAALLALLFIIAAGVVWLADPLASAKPSATRALLGAPSDQAPGAPAAAGSGSSVLQMAEVAAPDANTAAAGAGVAPTSIPTLRRWD